MTVISASGLSFEVGDRKILQDVSFSLNEGEKLGIIGVNGAGKTTLFRLLAGEYTPSAGAVYRAKDLSFGWLRQDEAVTVKDPAQTLLDYMTAAFPELLALEEEIADTEAAIAAAQEKGEEEKLLVLSARLSAAHEKYVAGDGLSFRARCRSMLLHMGFTEEELTRPLSSLSGGQHTRLALSRLLSRAPDILLLDEPTNHLDIDALLWLEEFLSAYPKTVLVISHDRYFLDRVTGKTLMIQYTRARLYPGAYTQANERMAADEAAQERQYREQQKEIARIRANIDFQRRCGQEHNFVTIRAKEKQLARMEKVEAVKAPPRGVRFSFQSEVSFSQDVLKARDLSFSYGGGPLLSHLSFLVKKDERLLILGANGCGKSTLMKLLVGKLTPAGGGFSFGEQVSIGYYDQEIRSFHEDKTVFEELHDEYPKKTNGEIRSALALFLFGAEDVDKPISALSGGEKARLTLAKLMLRPVNFLLLDEPTNHLDIGSREALETALSAFDGTIVAVSHDRYFIDRIATRILELSPDAPDGCISYTPYEGESAYACYRRHREAKEEKETATPTAKSDGRENYELQKRKNAEERAQKNRLEKAEKRIPVLEQTIEKLKAELFGEAAADYVRAASLQEEIDRAEAELLSLYELTMQ